LAKKNGRPTKYKVEYVDKVLWMARAHRTEEEIAEELGIAVSTLNVWKDKYPDFSEALKEGKKEVDDQVEDSLFQRAVGYEYTETKTVTDNDGLERVEVVDKQRAPDVTAQIFWLKNRRPDKWRDQQHHEHKIDGPLLIREYEGN
jgi:hypothetical protein